MKAVMKDFIEANRQQLHEIIPLDTPMTISIEASSACDLRCKFCALSSETALQQRNHTMKNMSEETFSIIVKQLKEFPQPLKRVYFVGLGEVLMNPRLSDMIRKAKQGKLAPEVMTYTNCVSLTHDKSLELVDSGLDILQISVNGLNADDYERNCGRRIDFDKYVEQIAFLYKNKKQLRILLKTVDLCINSEADRKFFFDTFGDLCDFINIETIATLHTGVDYSGDNIKNRNNISRHPSITTMRRVCSWPFYRLTVSSQGRVGFCDPVYGFPHDDLDIRRQSLVDMWNGATRKQILLNQLREINEGVTAYCKDCTGRHACTVEADNLDPYAEELYEKISDGIKK